MAKLSLLFSLFLCFLVFFNAQARRQGQQQQGQFQQCQVQNINALQPTRTIRSEAGVTEYWDENNEQLDCAGVAVVRYTINSRGLLLPHYYNAHHVTYVVQGRGIHGVAIPGCPETFQSSQQQQQQQQQIPGQQQSPWEHRGQQQGQGQQQQQSPWDRQGEYQGQGQQRQQQQGDRHQRVQFVRRGDIFTTPVGVAHWTYNDGETPLVLVTLLDTANSENQLDNNLRTFFLAGNPQQQGGHQQQGQQGERGSQGQQQGRQGQQGQQGGQQEISAANIFQNFRDETLADVLGVSPDTVRKMSAENDNRGTIIQVQNELQIVRPSRMREEQGSQGQEEEERWNGLEESSCNMKLRTNIDDPSQADYYNPRAGRITRVNSRKLPIFRLSQLNVERGVLYRNALTTLHWNMNAHSVIYVTGGSARVQIVGNYQQPIYDGELSQGQLLVVPQNFAVVKQAGDRGFEWVAFKTNDHAMTSPVAGRNGVLRALPREVLMNSYRISAQEADNLKYNREEHELFAPTRNQPRDPFSILA